MRMGRPLTPLMLTADERTTLESWVRRRATAQALALRARIVLQAAEGVSNMMIARRERIATPTAGKWRSRFLRKRLDGLLDDPRPGAPRTITDAAVDAVITQTLESIPSDATHWSTRSMAEVLGLSQSAVSRIWRAFALQPHRVDTFNLSKGPLLVDKVRDIAGLYLNPPDRALVLCADEKRQIGSLDRSRPILPVQPGVADRRVPHNRRHSCPSLFAALDVATGTGVGEGHRRHRSQTFLQFLKTIDATVPSGLDLHLILDTHETDTMPRARQWLATHPRVHVHVAHNVGFWLRLVERWFVLLSAQQMMDGARGSARALEDAIREYLDVTSELATPFVWTTTGDEISAAVAALSSNL